MWRHVTVDRMKRLFKFLQIPYFSWQTTLRLHFRLFDLRRLVSENHVGKCANTVYLCEVQVGVGDSGGAEISGVVELCECSNTEYVGGAQLFLEVGTAGVFYWLNLQGEKCVCVCVRACLCVCDTHTHKIVSDDLNDEF